MQITKDGNGFWIGIKSNGQKIMPIGGYTENHRKVVYSDDNLIIFEGKSNFGESNEHVKQLKKYTIYEINGTNPKEKSTIEGCQDFLGITTDGKIKLKKQDGKNYWAENFDLEGKKLDVILVQ